MTTQKKKTGKIKLVTHDGSFHADDVFAAAALSILLKKQKKALEIIRTRDPKIIESADYVFDVGGIYDQKRNRFDHHQRGGAGKRRNGIEYSSFGLIWKKFGKMISGSEETKNLIDRQLVEQVDAIDNGEHIFEPITAHLFNYDISSVIESFRPKWNEQKSSKFFRNAVKFARNILREDIKRFNSLKTLKGLIKQVYQKSKDKELLILNLNVPRYLVSIASSEYRNLFYVVFKDQKNWKVLAVRKRLWGFENKKNLPKSWAGLKNEKLQKVTGVKDAIFCHRRLYMAVAKSKEGAIKLAKIALES